MPAALAGCAMPCQGAGRQAWRLLPRTLTCREHAQFHAVPGGGLARPLHDTSCKLNVAGAAQELAGGAEQLPERMETMARELQALQEQARPRAPVGLSCSQHAGGKERELLKLRNKELCEWTWGCARMVRQAG